MNSLSSETNNSTSSSKNEVPSPLDVKSKDKGAQTLERFGYQFAYTALLAIQLRSRDSKYKELVCEHHEDILAVLENDKFEGIQIKTRELKYGPFKFTDSAMKKTITRFVKLDSKFPNKFEKFIIVSNCGFSHEEKNSILHLIKQALKPGTKNFQPTSAKKFVEKLAMDCDVSESQIITTLQKLECIEGPGLNDIRNTIIRGYLSPLQQTEIVYLKQLEDILDKIIQVIFYKSMNKVPDVITTYTNFLMTKLDKHTELINSKRITKETIDIIIKNHLKSVYLRSRKKVSEKLMDGSVDLMRRKMSLGGIDSLVINNMEDLLHSATHYITEQYHRNNDDDKAGERIEHILTLVQDSANEIRNQEQAKDGLHGPNMLHLTENALREISKKESGDVLGTPYRILKGFLALQTANCNVAFSEIPKGGFK